MKQDIIHPIKAATVNQLIDMLVTAVHPSTPFAEVNHMLQILTQLKTNPLRVVEAKLDEDEVPAPSGKADPELPAE